MQLGLKVVQLTGVTIPKEVRGLVSVDLLKKYTCIPFELDPYNANILHLAMADPMDMAAIDDISIVTNLQVEPYIASTRDVLAAIDRCYGASETLDAARRFTQERAQLRGNTADEDTDADVSDAPIVQLVRSLLEQAIRQRASDIHIEALETKVRVRYRIDGALYEKMVYDNSLLPAISTRIKILGGMDISEKRKPQDGRMSIMVDRQDYDIRISSLPTVHGEKIVMRISSKLNLTRNKKELGLPPDEMERFNHMLASPFGIILVTGPTGSGKTYLVKTLAKLLDVPLAITDATSLTEAGYIGDDIESVVSKLLAAADNDVERAEQGIIFIDEIDKIAKKKTSSQRDVSGESVQQGMLKLLEGSEVEVPVGANSKNAMVPLTTVNTKNILFICGGAFPDLEDIIKERLQKKTSMGFNAELKDTVEHDEELLSKVTIEDLRKFGMIPEFLGRLPIVFTLKGLDKEMLVKILKEPKNAILKQYQKLLALDEVKLEFDDSALEAIAEKAMEKDTGARALRAIIEEFMLDIMYEIPKDDNIGEVTITRAYIEGTGGPVIQLRGQAVPRLDG